MQLQLVVSAVALLSLFTSAESKPVMVQMVNCEDLDGTVPIPIFNSRYQILPNGSLCCPLDNYLPNGEPYCISKARAEEECAKTGQGLKPEPCAHCWTCAKLLGETCAGPQLSHGHCSDDLECFGTDQDQNGIGACTTKGGPRISAIGEKCGGRFGSLGTCTADLKCTEEDEDSVDGGVCIMEGQFTPFSSLIGSNSIQ